MNILIGDYCSAANESARHFYFNRARATAMAENYSCFGAGSAAPGGIREIPNTQTGAGATPAGSDLLEQAILSQHAAWFEHLRSAMGAGPIDLIELPSYYPFAHIVKRMLGVRLRFVLHGMNSQMLAASYENHASLFDYVRAWHKLEQSSICVADEIVAASEREKTAFTEQLSHTGDVAILDPCLFMPRSLPWSTGRGCTRDDREILHIIYAGPLDGIHQPHRLTELTPRVRDYEVHFRAYGPSLKFQSIEASEIVQSIAPQIDIPETDENWWDIEDPEHTIVAYPGIANVHWIPAYAALRGYTVCLSDAAGCKRLFDDRGLTYYRFEDAAELRPLPWATRVQNAQRLRAAAQGETVSNASIEMGERV
ncbi:hypothetical protein [Bradyrhizobium zhanjiangense]|uniref:hypothetical protein n=1 Tax=Bradyrhizobium zhanjiangense TaxID=1325107 RepID=UPI001008B21C|nr:hypothetical protein [Bradyrhizobium zhanjiangense]